MWMVEGSRERMSTSRHLAWRRGRLGELRACLYLRVRGFRILGRNVRMKRGELDVIACRGSLLVVAEVKRRDLLEEGLLSVTKRQQKRIVGGFEEWLSKEYELGRDWGDYAIRYDVLVVGRNFGVHHEEDAFRVDF